jgi:hypothetical protein
VECWVPPSRVAGASDRQPILHISPLSLHFVNQLLKHWKVIQWSRGPTSFLHRPVQRILTVPERRLVQIHVICNMVLQSSSYTATTHDHETDIYLYGKLQNIATMIRKEPPWTSNLWCIRKKKTWKSSEAAVVVKFSRSATWSCRGANATTWTAWGSEKYSGMG